MSAAAMIATHLNAPYGPIVTESDVIQTLTIGRLSASSTQANALLEALFIECELGLIERAVRENGIAIEQVRLLRESLQAR
ncbi:hypothetical protein ACFIQG_20515 [Comamonas odontotermitis]|uniref:hypothetical protein n=1 Tax=Comamonas odontotermitis TaxID=379895 RepID=UPI00366FBFE1